MSQDAKVSRRLYFYLRFLNIGALVQLFSTGRVVPNVVVDTVASGFLYNVGLIV